MGNSLEVQWLALGAFMAMGLGSIPGWGTKIPQASRCGQIWIFVCEGLWSVGYMVQFSVNQHCTQSSRLYLAALSQSCGSTQGPAGSQGASFPPLVSLVKISTFLRCCNDNGVQPVPRISKERKLIQNKTSCQYFN